MRPSSRLVSLTGLAVAAALLAAACTSAASTPGAAVLGATNTPTTAPAVATPVVTPSAAGATLTIGSAASPVTGAFLTGKDGMTLYILKSDTADKSTCSGSCATNWPPLVVASGTMTIAGPADATMAFATITRADGTLQVTYNHMPLYYFAGDSAAGDTKGEGKNNVWFVAPVSGTVLVPATPGPTSNGGSTY
jgi:predicted lipoprotein with Yx(FWY)xxD motif